MAKTYINTKNLRFLLHEVHAVEDVLAQEKFAHFDTESVNMLVDAAKQFSDTYLFPHYEGMDRNEPQLVDGEITVHESVIPFIKAAGEAGWIGASAPLDDGGMQAPSMLSVATGLIFAAGNNAATPFTGLTASVVNLFVEYGTPEQKAAYLDKLISGEWQGTMCLTEPQAGSSLSDITTSATPQPDGSYKIKGQKIYISGGDYQGIDNVVHMLLARIDGAPAGTKGISLFIVPKNRDGGQKPNDVSVAGLYHKMGQKGIPATHLMFGEDDDCVGYLIGEENKGLSCMFQMMNEARIGVGVGATGVASAAYHASLEYAQERPQGRRLDDRDLSKPQTLIINHPDVKRMLLLQKAVVEGSMSLAVACGKYADMADALEGEEAANAHLLLEILTPILKTYPSEMGITSISNGLQIFGGGGFCEDFPLENYYRDIRIFSIYEGTTGIQSQDLLGRKVTMKQGAAMKLLFGEIQKTVAAASTFEELKPYVDILNEKLQKVQQVSMHLVGFAMQGKIERFLSDATLYMELFSIMAIAWQWLAQAVAAKQQLLTQSLGEDEKAFYESKLHTMKYFYHYEVPKTLGLIQRLLDNEVLTIESEKELAW
ncbi:MAG: acyl-CoA dehydrogenase [Bacteroidota bacterium]